MKCVATAIGTSRGEKDGLPDAGEIYTNRRFYDMMLINEQAAPHGRRRKGPGGGRKGQPMVERLWTYFDSLEEPAYAVDLETMEPVFCNRSLRQMLGLGPQASLSGLRCHALLCGLDRPCPNCLERKADGALVTRVLRWHGRSYLRKITVLEEEGRRLRLAFAIDVTDVEGAWTSRTDMLRSEQIVNECLRIIHGNLDTDQALQEALAYLGSALEADRVYLFETDRHEIDNTYEWCAPGIPSQQERMRHVPAAPFQPWLDHLAAGENVSLEDLESIRETLPAIYCQLKPKGIRSLVATPLLYQGRLRGFLGVDNPPTARLSSISAGIRLLTHFFVSVLSRRDLHRRLVQTSYHDQLTGLLNRNAMNEAVEAMTGSGPLGVVFCDVTGLKRLNDSQGHRAGDLLLIRAAQLIQGVFSREQVYRVGGDEFLVLCPGATREELEEQTARLRQQAAESGQCDLAVGSVWSSGGEDVEALIERADAQMYLDKYRFYHTPRQVIPVQVGPSETGIPAPQEIKNFFKEYYLADELFSDANTPYYLFFGDIRRNVFYISDNMRRDFDFESTVVEDLIPQWGERIYERDRAAFFRELEDVFQQRKAVHDVKYRVRTVRGGYTWLHCRGSLKWSADGREALYFSGIVSNLESSVDAIDSVTGLFYYPTAMQDLSRMPRGSGPILAVGIRLNDYEYVNESVGRMTADLIVREAAQKLQEELEGRFFLYRLEGVRFLAISTRYPEQSLQEIADRILRAVGEVYQRHELCLRKNCAIGFVRCANPRDGAPEIIEQVLAALMEAREHPELDYFLMSREAQQQRQEKADLVLALHKSVNEDFSHFSIVIQPIVALETGRIVGGEALLRWSKDGEPLTPAQFIPILEENRLIIPVSKWVLEQAVKACRDILRLRPDFRLSFNISYLQMQDPTFFPYVHEILHRYGVPGDHVSMELTETYFDSMPERMLQMIRDCRGLGISMALDDFGNGYSALQCLFRYPIDTVKIDRSMMKQIQNSKENRQFLKTVIYACHQSGKTVCVEGVETEEELQVVRETECDYIQGFYFYRPQPPQALLRQLEAEDLAAPPTKE